MAADTAEQLRERVGWYERRPLVEEFHKAQKTGVDIEGLRFQSQAGLRPVARRTIGFGPLSFMGRPLVGEQRAVRINDRLQALADAGFPGLRWSGWHYLLRAHKDEPGDLQSP